MKAYTRIENNTVFNTVRPGSSLFDIAEYVEQHIDQWIGKHVVWDLREFDFDSLQPEDFAAYLPSLRRLAAKRMGFRTAVVVRSLPSFSKLHMFLIMIEGNLGIRLKAFRDHEEAARWAGARRAVCCET